MSVEAFALADTIGTIVAALLTLCVFSYLLGDNALWRLAEHLMAAVALGYVSVVAIHQVLAGKLLAPLAVALQAPGGPQASQLVRLLVPLVLGLGLIGASTRRPGLLSWAGKLSLALLLGVGAAVAVAGALTGTLLPQVLAAAGVRHYAQTYPRDLALFSGLAALVGTTGVLLHFYFGRGREGPRPDVRHSLVQTWGGLGWWFVLIALGAMLATTFVARVSQLGGRIEFLLDGARRLFGGGG